MPDAAEQGHGMSAETRAALVKRIEAAEALRAERKSISQLGLSTRDVSELRAAEKLVRDAKSKADFRNLAKRISTLLEDDRQK